MQGLRKHGFVIHNYWSSCHHSSNFAKVLLSERKKEDKNTQICFNCNQKFPENYNVCPKCGIRFGA